MHWAEEELKIKKREIRTIYLLREIKILKINANWAFKIVIGPIQQSYFIFIIISLDQMKNSLALLVFAAAVSVLLMSTLKSGHSTNAQFLNWKNKFGIQYNTASEQEYRSRIFAANLNKIAAHNANPDRTYSMGINLFTGMSQQEFEAQYLFEIDVQKMKTGRRVEVLENVQVDDIDWVEKGAVTKVKNQGACQAASWAFSATGSLEALSKIAYGTLRSFSDQQLLDCTGSFCSCSGGFTDMAFRYIEGKGLCQQTEYPYVAVKQTCKPTQCTFKISDYDYVDNCNGLGKLIAQRPISVAIEATNWNLYESGVFQNCGTKMNAMALLVGVTEGNWKLKNSWGATWGEQGYIRLAPGNTCGICSIGLYPLK